MLVRKIHLRKSPNAVGGRKNSKQNCNFEIYINYRIVISAPAGRETVDLSPSEPFNMLI